MAQSYQDQVEKYAVAIGLSLNEWGGVEDAIWQLFEAWSGMPGDKAMRIFTCIKSLEVRLDLCNALASLSGEDEVHVEVWDRLYAKVRKKYKLRHKLAHFAFISETTGQADGTQKSTALMVPFWPTPGFETRNRLTLAEIAQMGSDFKSVEQALMWFWNRARHRERYGESGPRQAPDLVLQLLQLAAQSRADKKLPPL